MGVGETGVYMARTQNGGKIAKCVMSLAQAIQRAGGSVGDHVLNMSLRDFITEVAGPNGIRFVYEKEKSEDEEEHDYETNKK
jgi:hypothetical protein